MEENTTELLIEGFLKKYDGQFRLAPLKINIPHLLAVLSDDDLQPMQIAKILYQYPVISARLIGLANSPWSSPTIPITNIEAACIRLGISLIKGVSIAIAVASSFNSARCPSFNPTRFWATSILVSTGAGLLATKLAEKSSYAADFVQTIQTGGILHNIGLLWLADNLATETEQALQKTVVNPKLVVNQTLLEIIGIDYCTIGAWICKQWDIPEVLISIIAQHRNQQNLTKTSIETSIVGAAVMMVSMLYHQGNLKTDERLLQLGINKDEQLHVFQNLSQKHSATEALAKLILS